MFRTIATTVLPWILLVGVVVWVELRDQARTATPPVGDTSRLESRVENLEEEVRRLREQVGSAARLRAAPAGHPAPAADASEGAPPEPAESGAGASSSMTEEQAVAALRARLEQGAMDATLLEAARSDPAFATLLETLEGEAAERPEDLERLFLLADAYLTKLYAVPDGPERAMWAVKAEGIWGRVLDQDPGNWEARFSRATSWSQWPKFLGKTPDAIEEFEALREMQAATRPEPRFANVYVRLGQLYVENGDVERARSVLEEGRKRHPDNERITKLLEGLPADR